VKMIIAVFAAAMLACGPAYAAASWQQYGGDASNNPVAASGPAPSLNQPRWTAGSALGISSTATPVIFDGKIYVYCVFGATTRVVALAVSNGSQLWSTPVDDSVMDSWSSPAIDPASRSVLIGSGTKVFALNADNGAVRWSTDLQMQIVNASVTIADRKAFIATYAPGDNGKLHALNLDTAAGAAGSTVWSKEIGATVGSTPAWYAGGPDSCVIVGDSEGYLRAFEPSAGVLKWTFAVPGAGNWRVPGGAFCGGVSVSGACVYAATYYFYGTGDSSFLYKLNAATGAKVWAVPSERTDAAPVVHNNIVLLSAGTVGHGSVVKLQVFSESTGEKLWEVAELGGWTFTPAVVNGICYVGTMNESGDSFDHYQTLSALDLSLTPGASGFVRSQYDGAGGTPGYADGNIYSVGTGGLHAFGVEPLQAWPVPGDANRDCSVNILDLIFVRNRLNLDSTSGDNWQADVDSNGKINILDLIFVRNRLNSKCP